jgi:hypothetical protein
MDTVNTSSRKRANQEKLNQSLAIDFGPKLTAFQITRNKQPTYYFFKRWLWLIFPNACLENSPDCNFSLFMQSCFGENQKTLLDDQNNR